VDDAVAVEEPGTRRRRYAVQVEIDPVLFDLADPIG